MPSETTQQSPSERPPQKKKGKPLKWVGIGLVLLVGGGGIWVWSQRGSIMENLTIKALQSQGIEGQITVVDLGLTHATFENIRLAYDGESFLDIKQLQADYKWQDALKGQFLRLDFDTVKAKISFDENWTPVDGWVPPGFGQNKSGATPNIPANGIGIKDSRLDIISPLGETTLYADGEIADIDNFTAEITLAPSKLSLFDLKGEAQGVAGISRADGLIQLDAQAQTGPVSGEALTLASAQIHSAGTLNWAEKNYDGTFNISGKEIDSSVFATHSLELDWEGQLTKHTQTETRPETKDGSEEIAASDVHAKGQWKVKTEAAKIPDPARARTLASTLSLQSALSAVPITENFSPDLYKMVLGFLSGTDLDGKGHFEMNEAGFALGLDAPIQLISKTDNRLSLNAPPNESFYQFDTQSQRVTAQMDAQFIRPAHLSLDKIKLQAVSENGWRLTGVQAFDATVKTSEDWIVQNKTGQNKTGQNDVGDLARLGPLQSSVKYNALNPARRTIQLNIGQVGAAETQPQLGLDFDGPLPGGHVTGLKTQGRVDIRLFPTRQEIDYTPTSLVPLQLERLETPTDWHISDARFEMDPTSHVFVRTEKESRITAQLTQAHFDIARPAQGELAEHHLSLGTDSLDIKGTLTPITPNSNSAPNSAPNSTARPAQNSSNIQDWALNFGPLTYESQTLPGEATTAQSQSLKMDLQLVPDQPTKVSLSSPDLDVQTPKFNLEDLQLDLNGASDDYAVTYKGGTLYWIGSDFAKAAQNAELDSFQIKGGVRFEKDQFIGTAETLITKANDAPVYINYSYSTNPNMTKGHGSYGKASLDIPLVEFEPKGLQPQMLMPGLRGQIAQVTGQTGVGLNVEFGDGKLISSSGYIHLIDIDFGTAPGPFEGVNTTINLSSLWPLKTTGFQDLSVRKFNPGIELENGQITFAITNEGVEIREAHWPFGSGGFSLDPMFWAFSTDENRVVLRLQNVKLSEILDEVGNESVKATGELEGVFPVVISGVDVSVDHGYLAVKEGGLIQYKAKNTANAAGQSNEYAGMAIEALRNFEYNSLYAEMDGPLDGNITIGINFDGQNEKVLNSQPFAFDITVSGELLNIARSFNSNGQIKSEVLRQAHAKDEEEAVDE